MLPSARGGGPRSPPALNAGHSRHAETSPRWTGLAEPAASSLAAFPDTLDPSV